MRLRVAGKEARLTYIGRPLSDGLRQVTAVLPEGLTAGFQPFELTCDATPATCVGFVHLIPPGPRVPRVVSVTDGVCVGAGRTISSNTVRVCVEETHQPERLRATLDGRTLHVIGFVCSSPQLERFEIDFKLPGGIPAGPKKLECWQGWRYLGATPIELAADRFWWRRLLHPVEFYQSLRRFLWGRIARLAAMGNGFPPDSAAT
jgi:hypothetical protein